MTGDTTDSSLLLAATNRLLPHHHHQDSSYTRMDDDRGSPSRNKGMSALLIGSYVLDWIVIIVFVGIGTYLGEVAPNKRPFSLHDPNISFPFTVKETVPTWLLLVCCAVIPIVAILIISLIFVPGPTVPKGTPKSLIWRRKLWELHIGWLGLLLALGGAWFITSSMKNMFGKPRPDLLSRCQPDLANVMQYVVGGIGWFNASEVAANPPYTGQLVSADICKNVDHKLLDDGFRSYPSGHSSGSAAGLIYLSLFIASKFALTIPFLAPPGYTDPSSFSAFPSRVRRPGSGRSATALSTGTSMGNDAFELVDRHGARSRHTDDGMLSAEKQRVSPSPLHSAPSVASARLQGAAPPIYLLALALLPFFGSVFIAGSRWFDFRHHGFDILFGYLIGVITAFFAFRYYHLPISQGAGWAWGPRSHDKALWAGVGSFTYATARGEFPSASEYGRVADDEEAVQYANSRIARDNTMSSSRGAQPIGMAVSTGGPTAAGAPRSTSPWMQPRSRSGSHSTNSEMGHPRAGGTPKRNMESVI